MRLRLEQVVRLLMAFVDRKFPISQTGPGRLET